MFKQTAIGLVCFLAGIVGGMGAISHSQVRLEASAGIADHFLAPEGSWWYDGFDKKTKLTTGGYQAGLLWAPLKSGAWSFGARVGYANLGTVQSWNSYPIFEDHSSRDARVNSVCNPSTLAGCTGSYNGRGNSSGYYFGPVAERDFGGGVAFGAEFGAFRYQSSWEADSVRVVENGQPVRAFDGTWDYARGYHVTSYAGASARWEWLQVSVRRYSNVHASRAEIDPMYVGMTSGPVWTVMVGLSIPL